MELLKEKSAEQLPAGDWHGNDTVWRAVSDINGILVHADSKGFIRKGYQRKFFSLVDGIISGELEGPLSPSPKHCGVVAAGEDFLSVDLALLELLGYDRNRIPLYASGRKPRYQLIRNTKFSIALKPSAGWKNHI
jgi:hypothetical protein